MAQQFETLPCKLTDDEIRTLGRQLARTNKLLNDMREAKITSMANMAASMKTIERNVAVLAQKIDQGFEPREVEVITLMDTPRTGTKTIVRTDTNEPVRTEAMTPEEQQSSFDFDAKARKQ